MSSKKRGIMLKNLAVADDGMQELINPVPLELILDEDASTDMQLELDELIATENAAMKEALTMLEDTAQILETFEPDQKKA